jgi:hypothetical protein
MWSRGHSLFQDRSSKGFVVNFPEKPRSRYIAELFQGKYGVDVSQYCNPIGYRMGDDIRDVFLD